MENLEIKCPLSDRAGIEARLGSLGGRLVWRRRQRDTFFATPSGWLKLREAEGAAPELISYVRPETTVARASTYDVEPLADAHRWKRLLSRVLPVEAVVEKERTLWLLGHTRIHLDRVTDLGDYLELETVMDGITSDEASAELDSLVSALALDRGRFIPVPYRVLLDAARTA